jgi:hypothetical protein
VRGEDVLEDDRDAEQRRALTARQALVGRGGLGERALRSRRQQRVESRLDALDAREKGARQLGRRDGARVERLAGAGNRGGGIGRLQATTR